MVVAIDLDFQQRQTDRSSTIFFTEVFNSILFANKNIRLIIITDAHSDKPTLLLPPEVEIKYINRSNWLAKKRWQIQQLPSFVKKNGINILITKAASRPIKHIHHWLLFADDVSPDFISTNTLAGYQKIITPSFHTKSKLLAVHPQFTTAIEVLNGVALLDKCQSAEATKMAYTNGKEYFACLCHNEADCMLVLKAFSLFKKRQQTNRKLVFILPPPESVLKKLEAYKYRTDVVILSSSKETQQNVLAAAYAAIFIGMPDGWGQLILQAVSEGVPVITTSALPAQEYGGASIIAIDAVEPDALANQLMRLYKDETWHKQLQQAALEKCKEYTIDKAANKLWQLLVNAK
jgi:glycosyltransferase involved in cell wall biosynthesis